MSVSVLDMSVSLDGYIAGPDDFLGGDNGERLHEWSTPGDEFAFLAEWKTAGAESAMAQAKAAAGDHNVQVRGAYTAQRAIEAGVLDELQIHQVPVLLGGGRRLFDTLPSLVELDVVQVIDTAAATHLRYRIRR